ncbi:hypothetical protein [Secundilactobacillus yichangensis]|uniref:hypothetical protein n=1 Tax=Secundilactobacillus yichangensis TaxID=2799580 RepID=UPI0019428533|nr:hypothetical protein [Secundilactobacillus yichangensis]
MLTIKGLKSNQSVAEPSTLKQDEIYRQFEQVVVTRLLNNDEIRKAMAILSKI